MRNTTHTVTSFSRSRLVLAVLSLALLALLGGRLISAHKGQVSAQQARQQAGSVRAAVSGVPTHFAPLVPSAPAVAVQTVMEKVEPGARRLSEETYGPFDYARFLEREKNGEFPPQSGPVPPDAPLDSLTNNNGGATGTSQFTQSETSVVVFGNTVVIGFNDAGSNAGGTNKFTGFTRSTDGGNTFSDGGTLPTNAGGDAGDAVLARNETTGRIYFSTLGFSISTIQVFRSDDNGATWMAPVNGTPGGDNEDKQWLAVDNFPGAGNGNVYLLSRRFGAGPGIYFFRSTDNGATFGPSGGTSIVGGSQGAYVAVGPDHAVYAFWFAGPTIQVRKSLDLGVTFGAAVTVASGLVGGTNGDLGLTGIRQGTATAAGFRSNEFPHAAVNPANGNIYVTYNNDGPGADKADVFIVQSTTGGATWSAPVKVNDDVTTTDQWQPTIAVTPDGSTLGIFYYSRQDDPVNNNLFKYHGRTALISGATLTFPPSFVVSSTPSFPEFGRDSLINSVYMGDYNTAFATAGAFHVVWSDNRDDLPGGAGRKDPNVYYQKIALGLSVTTTVPAVGAIVPTIPLSYVVNFTDPIQVVTVQASDFTVDGVPANTFIVNTATQVTFNYSSMPFSTQGLHTMAMAAGSVLRDPDGNPLNAFTGTFRYDTLLLQVVSTVPPFPNGVFTLPGPFTYDVNFNEPVDPASVQTADLMLSGIAGATVSGVTVLPGNTTARFTLSGITVEGTLTASIAAGLVTDAFGNPGAAFTANYGVDIGTVPYPTPLLAKNPLGSLIYDPAIAGMINFAGDTDNFTLNIDPNQTISLLLTPTSASLQPRIELFDPANASLGFASAPAVGQVTGIQTRLAVSGGVYRFAVSGVGGTTGGYTLAVILNAAFELEGQVVGASNNSIATAQDINGSFITLQTAQASAQRGAVSGVSDNANYAAAAVPFAFEDISGTGAVIAPLTGVDDVSTSIPIGFTFPFYGTNNTNVSVSSNGLLVFGGTDATFSNSDLTTTPSLAGIAPFWDDQHTAGGVAGSNVFSQVIGAGPNQHLTIQWNRVRFFSGGTVGDTLTYQVQLYADGRIQFNYQDLVSGTAAGNNGASATVGIKGAGTQGPMRLLLAFNNGPNAFVGTGQSTLLSPPNPTPDLYSFTASAGDVVTLAVKALGMGAANIALLDSGGAVIAPGVGGSTNLDSVVSNFPIGAGGTYYARVNSSAAVAYNLVVTRNAAFDTEANDSFGTAQPLAGNRGALGGIAPGMTYLANAVPFAFEDISGTGAVIAGLTNQDDTSVSIPVGFNFPFFGTNNTTVFVSSNGLLTFGSGNTTFTNADLTTTPTQAAIAPFWDDQHTAGGVAGSNVFSQVLGAGPNQHLTIQWNQVRFFSGGTVGDTLTYQVQLFADGRIQFNYQDLVSAGAAGNNGASATVGLKAAGAQGPNRLLLAFNNGPNAFVGTGQSTLIFQPPGDDWYSLILGAGQATVLAQTSTPADGPGEFVNVLNPHIELYSPANVLLASGVTLGDGRNEGISISGLAPGAYRIRVTSEANTTGEYFLTALAGCPTITISPAPPNGQTGVAYSHTFTQTGAFGGSASWSVSAGVLPPGLTLNASSGLLAGMPTATGVYSFTIKATDSFGCMGLQAYTVTITCGPVTITTASPLPNGQAGIPYSQTLAASGTIGALTWSGTAPAGLTLNANGTITGTPNAVGVFTVNATVTDGAGCPATKSFALTITCPALTVANPPNATAGAAYNATLVASPAGGAYTFSGTAPTGLTLASNGALSGTPPAAGSFTFTVSVTGFGGACVQNVNVTLVVTCPAITLAPASLPTGVQGLVYNQTVTASPAGGNYSYAVTTNVLPPGLSLNPTTGAITGTPSAPNNYTFVITATGFGGCTKSQAYNLLVTATCGTITLNPASLPGGALGAAYNTTVSASPAAAYSFAVVGGALPGGLALNAATGVISGTPTAAGTFTPTIRALGPGGCTGQRTYVLIVTCAAVTVNPLSLPNGNVGVAYSQTLSASPAATYTFSLLLGSLPPGFTLNSAGVLSGISSVPGTYTFTVRALTSTGNCSGTRQYTVSINP